MVVGLIALMGEWGVGNTEIQGWPKVRRGSQMANFCNCLLPLKNVAHF